MFQTSKITMIKLVLIFCVAGMSGLVLTPLVSTASPKPAVITHQDITKVQKTLRSGGYYRGRVDGLMGPQTRAAIRQYQKSNQLAATGRLDAQTAGKLGVGSESTGGNFKSAGKSVGRGSMEAGHQMKEGKPIASGKEFGKGVGRGGKYVGKGVKKAVSLGSSNDNQKQ